MTPTFYALVNQLGIACASNSDHTIYKLSNQEPFAVAVNPQSKIPWDSIINQYIRKGEPKHHNTLPGYICDFSMHLSNATIKMNPADIDEKDAKIIFMGYGLNDIYPSVCETEVEYNYRFQSFDIKPKAPNNIDIYNRAFYITMGDTDCLSPILTGYTIKIKKEISEMFFNAYKNYKNNILKKFAGTAIEPQLKEYFGKVKINHRIEECFNTATEGTLYQLKEGLDSFSIEDMVSSAETLVNATDRLNHLWSTGTDQLGHTREIAVLTRAEGVTWIKHCLFAI